MAADDVVSTVTDQNGEVVLKGFHPGDYRVLALVETVIDPANAPEAFLARRAEGERVTIATGESRSMQIKAVDAGASR